MENRILKCENNIKDIVDRVDRHRKDLTSVAKLSTFTARGLEQVESKTSLTLYLNGPLKDEIAEEFHAHRKRSKEHTVA